MNRLQIIKALSFGCEGTRKASLELDFNPAEPDQKF
jgi:hypothetical protein